MNIKDQWIAKGFKQAHDTYIKYEKGYEILMDYFDCIPEAEREDVDKQLKKVGL